MWTPLARIGMGFGLSAMIVFAAGCELYFGSGGSGDACGSSGEPCNDGLTCGTGTCSAVGSDGGIAGDAGGEGSLTPDFAWYLLDETSGTTAHDSSSNHYDITNLAGVVWGAGASFDSSIGVCGSVSVAAEFREPPITISAWLTPQPRSDSTITEYAYDPYPSNAVSGDVPTLGGYGLGINV
jgi:hypothetical protein